MNAVLLDTSQARARALCDFRRGHRPRRRLSLYHLYVLVVLGGIGGSLAEHALAGLIGQGVTVHQFVVGGPAVLLVLMLLTVRFGSWHGPVGFSRPDIALMLTAPIAIAVFVRPRLDHALLISLIAGAIAGALVVLVIHGGPVGLGAARVAGTAISTVCVSVALVASSWLVESSRRLAHWIRRSGPLPVVSVVGLAVLGWSLGKAVAVWFGPWGWALAPLVGGAAWPIATSLLVCLTVALVVAGRRRVGSVDAEMLAAHADVRSRLGASVFTMDYRSAGLAYRDAASSRARASVLRRSSPRSRRFLLVWRDAIALGHEPARLLWASVLMVGATLEAIGHPGRLVPAVLASAAVYAAATLLSESARLDVDSPDRVTVLTSRRFARVLVEHCVLPAATLFVMATLAVIGAIVAGSAGTAALLLVPALLFPGIVIAALASVLAARRGGRINENLLTRILATDPSNPGGAAIIALWLAPFLAATLLTVGVPVAIIGHAIVHHSSTLVAGALACIFMTCMAGWLMVVGLRTRLSE